MFGAPLEVELAKICTTPARESDSEVKIVKNWRSRDVLEVQSGFRVAGAGISTRCKIRGRRRSSWGLQKRWQAWWIWRGSETMRFAWQAQWFRALWCRCLKPLTLNPWKGCKFHVTEVLLCSDHFAWQSQDFVPRLNFFMAGAVLLKHPFKNRSNVLEFWGQASGQLVIFEGSLAKMLRFWSSKFHFWRKSRRKASFLSFKASFLKEVSQKSFVFEFQSFNFEGSLAEKFRFWASMLQFWRKSRRKASFLSFKASFLKEVSQKSFVFELQSFNFEGSLAEKFRFWVSKLQFWRKSRSKASFLSFKASILKEVSQKCFVFELQSFNFEGSLAEKLRLTK